MIRIDDVLDISDMIHHLGIDGCDSMIFNNLKSAIRYADGELRESVGDHYPKPHPLTSELAKIYATVSYEQRDLTGNELKRANDIALKLRLVMRRRENE